MKCGLHWRLSLLHLHGMQLIKFDISLIVILFHASWVISDNLCREIDILLPWTLYSLPSSRHLIATWSFIVFHSDLMGFNQVRMLARTWNFIKSIQISHSSGSFVARSIIQHQSGIGSHANLMFDERQKFSPVALRGHSTPYFMAN